MKRKTSIIILFILFVCVGAFTYTYFNRPSLPKNISQITTKSNKPTAVATTIAKVEPWQEQLWTSGTLQAYEGVTIQSAVQTGAVISQILFESGAKVKKGQTLFVLSPGDIRISAPFAGKLGLKQVSVGDYVPPGTELITLQQLNPMKIEFAVPQNKMAGLKTGNKVDILTNTYPDEVFTGEVYAIDAQLDPETRSVKVWATIPNNEEKLLPGTFANIRLLLGDVYEFVTLPQSAIVYSREANHVFAIVDDKAIQKDVKLGKMRKNDIAILEGVEAGENIVVSGAQKLTNDTPVTISKIVNGNKAENNQ